MEKKYLYSTIVLFSLIFLYVFISSNQIKNNSSKIDFLDKRVSIFSFRLGSVESRMDKLETKFVLLQKDIFQIKKSIIKTASYINRLEKKLWEAIIEKDKLRISNLNRIIALENQRKEILESSLSEKQEESVGILQARAGSLSVNLKPVAASNAGTRKSLLDFGFSGGAPTIGIGYEMPSMFANVVNLQTKAYYGAGSDYSMFAVKSEGVYGFPAGFTGGLSVDYVDYTKRVAGITGLEALVSKGGRVGVGVFGGREFGLLNLQLGYSTALGLSLMSQYRF